MGNSLIFSKISEPKNTWPRAAALEGTLEYEDIAFVGRFTSIIGVSIVAERRTAIHQAAVIAVGLLQSSICTRTENGSSSSMDSLGSNPFQSGSKAR